MSMSSLLGVTLPVGWLCAMMTALGKFRGRSDQGGLGRPQTVDIHEIDLGFRI